MTLATAIGMVLAAKNALTEYLCTILLVSGIGLLYAKSAVDLFTTLASSTCTFVLNGAIIAIYLALGVLSGPNSEAPEENNRFKRKYAVKLATVLESTLGGFLPLEQPSTENAPKHRFLQKFHHYFPKREPDQRSVHQNN